MSDEPRRAVYFLPSQKSLALAYAREHAHQYGYGWLRVDTDGSLTLLPPESILVDTSKVAEQPVTP